MKRRIITAIATGAVLIYALTPMAYAATTIIISGNGTGSTNTSDVNLGQTTTVVQSNNADINNSVNADADTGGNDANDNTGGDVSVETGDADVDVTVSNTANSNVANVDCCPTGDTTVEISGNGSDSENNAELTTEKKTEVFQSNDADIRNRIWADADTGDNDAKDNTGGSVSIETGDADTSVDVSNTANANVANVGGDDEDGGSVSLVISGNGTESTNTISLALGSEVLLVQENESDIKNEIWADADTGDNDAEDNTGGDVVIDTGDADVDVDVDNDVNFNVADVDCDCIIDDILAKISGNGEDSESTIKAEIGESLEVFQENCGENGLELSLIDHEQGDCELNNHVDADADTGDNDAKDNTGDPDGDPSVETGDADADVDLDNSGNVNVFGQGADLDLPDFDLDLDLDFSFNLSDLLELLGLA